MQNLVQLLHSESEKQGFFTSGGVDLIEVLPRLSNLSKRLSKHVEKGFHADMYYLARNEHLRSDPRNLYVQAQSAWCVGLALPKNHELGEWNQQSGKIARYALLTNDYHDEVKQRLKKVIQTAGVQARIAVDTVPLFEKALAAWSGLGSVGKNTLLIHPRQGSYWVIGVALLNVALGLKPVTEYEDSYEGMNSLDLCKNCDRCLTACPGHSGKKALIKPYELDSRQCISYLTTERQRLFPTLAPLPKAETAGWVRGCDICQEVCPYNR